MGPIGGESGGEGGRVYVRVCDTVRVGCTRCRCPQSAGGNRRCGGERRSGGCRSPAPSAAQEGRHVRASAVDTGVFPAM